jgi:hypothetical protein
MNIILTESQLRKVVETKVYSDKSNNDEISNSFINQGHYKWFNTEKYSNYPKHIIEYSLMMTLKTLHKQYGYQLKRVVVKDKGEIVGFLIWSDSGSKLDDLGDDKNYQVLLATAVSPEYRNKGLLRKMIEKSGIQKPYLVHTSVMSPEGLWEKMGCKVVKKLDDNDNKIEMCN